MATTRNSDPDDIRNRIEQIEHELIQVKAIIPPKTSDDEGSTVPEAYPSQLSMAMNYAPAVPSSSPPLTSGCYTSQASQPSSREWDGMWVPENKPPTSSSTTSIHRPPSSINAATQHSAGQGGSPEILTDGPDVSVSASSSSSAKRTTKDPLADARRSQNSRIIAAGKTLKMVNVEIEYILTCDRKPPFDFNRNFSSYSFSEQYKWVNEVLGIMLKVVPTVDWTFEDARARLKILCVDTRRNEKNKNKRALQRANSPSSSKSETDVTVARFSPLAQISSSPPPAQPEPISLLPNTHRTPILPATAQSSRLAPVHRTPILCPSPADILTDESANLIAMAATEDYPMDSSSPPPPPTPTAQTERRERQQAQDADRVRTAPVASMMQPGEPRATKSKTARFGKK